MASVKTRSGTTILKNLVKPLIPIIFASKPHTMSFTKSVYHIVFGTKHRQAVIPIEHERRVYKILFDLMKSYGAYVYRIGGMPDHVHILVDISSKNALADFVKRLKQESSFLIKNDGIFPGWCGWSEGYGAFTYSSSDIPSVMQYICNQKEHHKKISFIDEYRQWLIEMGVSPDAPFFPK